MLNSIKMKLYKLFVSKSTYVLCAICFGLAALSSFFSGYVYKYVSDEAVTSIKYNLDKKIFSENDDVILYLLIGFIISVAAFSLKGYIKSISAYVQGTFVDVVTDVIVGIVLWFTLFLCENIGAIVGSVIIFGSGFGFDNIDDVTLVLAKFGAILLLVVAFILFINVLCKLTKKVSATMAISILTVILLPNITSLFNLFLDKKFDISTEVAMRFELVSSQFLLYNEKISLSLSNVGIIACSYVGYCVVFGFILFLLRKKDRI